LNKLIIKDVNTKGEHAWRIALYNGTRLAVMM